MPNGKATGETDYSSAALRDARAADWQKPRVPSAAAEFTLGYSRSSLRDNVGSVCGGVCELESQRVTSQQVSESAGSGGAVFGQNNAGLHRAVGV